MVRCLIIDDEKNARENLENLVGKYCPELTVLRIAHSGMNGIQRIRPKTRRHLSRCAHERH